MATGALTPLHVFKFQVDFFTDSLSNGASHSQFQVCSGAFAECTVVLKRGISTNQNLYQIFNTLAIGTFAPRMQVTINVCDIDGSAILAWQLDRAMPIKYKFADLNSRNGEVGIEELHLVHEGLWSVTPTTYQI
jgi:phage tail-like protein